MRKPANHRLGVKRLELVQPAAIDNPRNHLAHLVRLANVLVDDPVHLARVVRRLFHRPHVQSRRRLARAIQMRHNVSRDRQRILVIHRIVIGHPRRPAVHIRPAEVLRRHVLPRRRLHQRRPAQENRPLLPHDHALVAHRRHVRPARRARTEHHRDLRNPQPRHPRLVEENPPEVLLIRKHLRLQRQKRPARVHEIDARQPVLLRDLLRPQVLLHRYRVIRPALHRRVVRDDHALAPLDPPDPRDDPRPRRLVVVHAARRQRAELQERPARVEQLLDPLPHHQLPALRMFLDRRRPATLLHPLDPPPQIGHQPLHVRLVLDKGRIRRLDLRLNLFHTRARPICPRRV